MNDEEIDKLAKFRGDVRHEFVALYTKTLRGKVTLREKANGDCIFYHADRGCTVYPVRPRQCRTWPFWESNLVSQETWERTEDQCPGSGEGPIIPVEEILRRVKVIKI